MLLGRVRGHRRCCHRRRLLAACAREKKKQTMSSLVRYESDEGTESLTCRTRLSRTIPQDHITWIHQHFHVSGHKIYSWGGSRLGDAKEHGAGEVGETWDTCTYVRLSACSLYVGRHIRWFKSRPITTPETSNPHAIRRHPNAC